MNDEFFYKIENYTFTEYLHDQYKIDSEIILNSDQYADSKLIVTISLYKVKGKDKYKFKIEVMLVCMLLELNDDYKDEYIYLREKKYSRDELLLELDDIIENEKVLEYKNKKRRKVHFSFKNNTFTQCLSNIRLLLDMGIKEEYIKNKNDILDTFTLYFELERKNYILESTVYCNNDSLYCLDFILSEQALDGKYKYITKRYNKSEIFFTMNECIHRILEMMSRDNEIRLKSEDKELFVLSFYPGINVSIEKGLSEMMMKMLERKIDNEK